MHNFLIAALQVLIFKLSNHTDIVIGTVNSGRNHPETKDVIGMFVKTLPLRTQLQATDTFEKILTKVKTDIVRLDEFQDISSPTQNKILFDVLLAFQNTDFSHKETIILEKNTLTAFPIDVSYSRLPLLFNFEVVLNELKIHISYNLKKYNEDTIQWIWAKYKKLIEELIKFPQQQLSEIEILLSFEEEDILDVDFNF